jgi:hypothetical protein
MAKATNFRDRPHARIYAHWRTYPAWRALTLAARALLVEILLEYRPGLNGRLEWSCRKAGTTIGVSKDRAARALTQLELLGRLKVERPAKFGRRNAPARYALTIYPNDETGDPASFAFEHVDPSNPLLGRYRVAPQGHGGFISGTAASHQRDANGDIGGFYQAGELLKSSQLFKRMKAETTRQAKG